MSADDEHGSAPDLGVDDGEPDLDFPYEDLYYIKLISGEKNPLEPWGGYSQNFAEAVESDDPEINVYTHEQVVESDHDHWGIVGIMNPARSLLIYDLDIYKAPDFDRDEIMVDGSEAVPVVESRRGGNHTFTAVYEERGAGDESDFTVDDELPFDIDIRGSFVKHHVVAPDEIPGVESEYHLINDVPIRTYSDVRDSAAALKYADTEEPIIDYDPSTGVGDFDYERSTEPPEEMPTCYARGLQLRNANPDDHPNTHKVNTLTALCGLAAGYEVEDMVEHFVDQYPPGESADREETQYQLQHMLDKVERGDLVPPSISTLREWGILDEDETCTCDIDYHGDDAGDDVSHPVYTVLDPEQGDVELHLVPVDGTSSVVEIRQNGKVEYSEVLDRGFWNNRTIRDRVASEVANTLTGVDHEAVKRGVKDALNQVGIDEREEPDEFEADMRSDREQELRDRTIEVVCHPTADTAEWVVTMEPPADSPVTDPRELSFSEGDFNDGNAGTFKNLHVAKFYTKAELDHEEWDGLTDYWLAEQVTADYEPDLDLEAAVDKFTEWAENLRVWADEDGFSWSNPHGYFVEEYHDGEDAVLVPGQKVADWKKRENVDPDLNLSRELRARDIMVRSTTARRINGKRRRVWPVDAEAVGHSAETAQRTETDADEDGDDDRPEGLR